uniref:Uncharacterized protein n=1 Tax=Rhizophora mucronata TaxID=61149 RepID=A0A2P2NVG1_RHIMU
MLVICFPATYHKLHRFYSDKCVFLGHFHGFLGWLL